MMTFDVLQQLKPNKAFRFLLVLSAFMLVTYNDSAQARHHYYGAAYGRQRLAFRVAHPRAVRPAFWGHGRQVAHTAPHQESGGRYLSPPGFAAIVVDANSGRTLYGLKEDQQRHPASVTKVMTLYLLFEQLEAGRLNLHSPLRISSTPPRRRPASSISSRARRSRSRTRSRRSSRNPPMTSRSPSPRRSAATRSISLR